MTIQNEAAEVMEHLCRHSIHGYSQPNRQGVGTGGKASETLTLSDGRKVEIAYGDRDCSSAVIECFSVLGVDCGGAWRTGDMRQKMCATGNFKALPASTWRNPQRGDILLSEGKHTALALGDGKLGEFLRSENHTAHGKVGDQDGGESVVRALYDDSWDCVLRYVGPQTGVPEGAETSTAGVGGAYTVVDPEGLNVREKPSTGAAVTGTLPTGYVVTLDSWAAQADGWLWGRYTANSGKTRYVAVEGASGSPVLLRKGGSTAPKVEAGTYRVTAASLNVREGASTSSCVLTAYRRGQTVVLDGTSTVAGGYVWGRYRAASGRLRWIAVGKADGSETYAVKA